jgi:rhodanese-related sulfurtransferase
MNKNNSPIPLIGLMLMAVLLTLPMLAKAEDDVKITADLAYLDVMHNGKKVRIERVKDTSNRLTNSFTKTSRPCPPFCVHPIKLAPGIETVGELELLEFLGTEVKQGTGVLIDARMPQWFEKSTIPGSINIPFTILTTGLDNKYTKKIIKLLGARESTNGEWGFDKVKALALFCNGLWCDQSSRAIKSLIKIGYPREKLFWYRGGMQAWQLLGLTTVAP